jgi:tRNA (cmo5U34)-methyltransferase
MLERAKERISKEAPSGIRIFEGDFRAIPFEEAGYDVIIAAAVLHHLRDDRDWEEAFQKIYRLLRPGGSSWITDLVAQESEAIHQLMWHRYGNYLETLGGAAYRDELLAYIAKEDSPRSVTYQIELMRRVRFDSVEILHKNSCFAAFGGVKGG